MNLYEMYGRQAEELHQLHSTWLKTLELLRAIRDGEVKPKSLDIDENGWRIK